MLHSLRLDVELPTELAHFRLPKGVERRLHSLLTRQDSGSPLTPEEQQEAEGLVELAETLTLFRLRAERPDRDDGEAE